MSQNKLERAALAWFSQQDPEVDALNLQRRYLGCVNVFRNIIRCAPGGRNGIRHFSRPINMGMLDHPDAGPMRLDARVNIQELDVANIASSGFTAYVNYTGTAEHARSEQFEQITFGASSYGGSVNMVPEFVRMPDTYHAAPWNDAPVRSYHGGVENVWDRPTVREIGRVVGKMLDIAEEAQYDLVDALRNHSLNPKFAPAAEVLFPLPTTP